MCVWRQPIVQVITTHVVHMALNRRNWLHATRRSQVVRKPIVGKIRGKATGEVVIPSRDPAAQVGDPRLIKPVFSKVFVGEDADAGEMIRIVSRSRSGS